MLRIDTPLKSSNRHVIKNLLTIIYRVIKGWRLQHFGGAGGRDWSRAWLGSGEWQAEALSGMGQICDVEKRPAAWPHQVLEISSDLKANQAYLKYINGELHVCGIFWKFVKNLSDRMPAFLSFAVKTCILLVYFSSKYITPSYAQTICILRLFRRYFGEKVSLYFCWLGFYTTWLIVPSIVGVVCFLYGIITFNQNEIAWVLLPSRGSPSWISDAIIQLNASNLRDSLPRLLSNKKRNSWFWLDKNLHKYHVTCWWCFVIDPLNPHDFLLFLLGGPISLGFHLLSIWSGYKMLFVCVICSLLDNLC